MAHVPMKWRRGRRALVAGLVLLAVCGLVVSFAPPPSMWFGSGDSDRDWPTVAEVMARDASEPVTLAVGPNVCVSLANALSHHQECVVAADPADPKTLVAAAMSLQPAGQHAVLAYRSGDGGLTWQPSFGRDDPAEHQCDPSLAFGPDGVLHLVTMPRPHPDPASGPLLVEFRFHRSADAGRSWEAGGVVTGPRTGEGVGIDRPFLAVDRTTGPRRGHLYCASNFGYFHDSADQGRTFRGLKSDPAAHDAMGQPTSPVVLSSGVVVCARLDWRQNPREPIGLSAFASDDGGRTLRLQGTATPRWRDPARHVSGITCLPALAADAEDRLFAVWQDGDHPGRNRLVFARSADQGRTWTRPVILSEQPADGSGEYVATMPAIAVTNRGVVGVSWYDRRGLPGLASPVRASNNWGVGCNVRLRVSHDGGDTWQPSVPVNDQPIRASVWDLRDTAGLAADADGALHPVWIDDRTGVQQVWTATVRVGTR